MLPASVELTDLYGRLTRRGGFGTRLLHRQDKLFLSFHHLLLVDLIVVLIEWISIDQRSLNLMWNHAAWNHAAGQLRRSADAALRLACGGSEKDGQCELRQYPCAESGRNVTDFFFFFFFFFLVSVFGATPLYEKTEHRASPRLRLTYAKAQLYARVRLTDQLVLRSLFFSMLSRYSRGTGAGDCFAKCSPKDMRDITSDCYTVGNSTSTIIQLTMFQNTLLAASSELYRRRICT